MNIFPPKHIVHKYKVENPKVVILGQDPSYQQGVSNGLAFSVNRWVRLPDNLKNIFKELESDLGIKRTNGDLTDWKQQGVVLLNTTLTVEAGKPGSHVDKWKNFTTNLIEQYGKDESIIWVLWGNHAAPYKKYIKGPIIESSGPSPSGSRHGFLGSKPFSRVNELLLKQGKEEIIW